MRSLVLLLVLASASWATALAQDTPTMVAAKKAVANKAVVASANAKVAAVKANIAPCSDLATVEKMLPVREDGSRFSSHRKNNRQPKDDPGGRPPGRAPSPLAAILRAHAVGGGDGLA